MAMHDLVALSVAGIAPIVLFAMLRDSVPLRSEDDDLIYKWILADTGGIAFFGYAHYSAHSSELTVARIADDRVKGIGDPDA